MARNKRGHFERENDLQRITELYLKQYRQVDIAKIIGVSQQQISWDLKEVQRRWLNLELHDMNEIKHRELDKIDTLEREYWQAWERSKGKKIDDLPTQNPKPKKKRSKGRNVLDEVAEFLEDTEPEPVVATITATAEPYGDPRYLTGVQWCINRRLVLLGLDTAAKAVSTSTQPTAENEKVRLDKLRVLMKKAEQRSKETVQVNGQG